MASPGTAVPVTEKGHAPVSSESTTKPVLLLTIGRTVGYCVSFILPITLVRLFTPAEDRRKMQLFQKFQRPNHRLGWQTNNMLSVTGTVEHSLEVFTHGSEVVSPDIEGIVHTSRIEGRTKMDSNQPG